MENLELRVSAQVYPRGITYQNNRRGAIDCLNDQCEDPVSMDAVVIRDGPQCWIVFDRESGGSYRVWPTMGDYEDLDYDEVATYFGFGED